MIAWMVYAAVVGGVVAVGGLAMERLAAAMGQPRRIAWLAALALAVVIPVTGGWSKPAAVSVVVESGTPEPAVTASASSGDLWSVIPALPVPEGIPTGRIALLAWVVGSLASLAVLGGVLVLVARGRRRWERRRVHGAEVYVSRRFGPALVGVTRPAVVIPAWVLQLEPGARDAIIQHEAEHARARDHLVLLYGGLVAAAFPWSPAIWWMYRRLRAAVELDCDQRVLASGIGVADYGDVLLDAGSRSRDRWGFAPAMGQPESLLERRLKTMSEKRKTLSGGYAALLVAVAVGALVVACDTPVPTELRDAMEEVMADEGADTETDRTERFLGWKDFVRPDDLAPLIFVDGVRIRDFDDVPESLRVRFKDGLEPDAIDRIEVLKGPAAQKLYGDEAAAGVIQIFTEDGEPGPEVIIVPGQAIESVIAPELIDAPRGSAIVVTGFARQKPRVTVSEMPVRQFVVARQARATDQASDWDMWFSEDVFAKAPPGWKPVVYVDGVRVDGGGAGLNDLLSALTPEQIDRIEVGKGEVAGKLYGKEGENGVIHIYTRKKSSESPVPEAEKDGKASSKRSPADSP